MTENEAPDPRHPDRPAPRGGPPPRYMDDPAAPLTPRPARPGRVRRGIGMGLLALLALAIFGWAWVWFAPCWLGGCAPVQEMARFQAEGSELLDVDGEPFGMLATVNRRIVSVDSLPPHLTQAFLAIEDRRFYQHSGIDWRRMAGATRATFGAMIGTGGRVEGGSTITMQLARNLFPDQLPYTERSPRRKVMEARIARQIERAFPKDKILELYLNHIYLGSGAYGVEAAAQTYFGKPASEVDLAEAALLGALPRAPSVLDPTRNRERALERRNLVLREMAEAGYVTAEEAEEAREQPIRLARGETEEDIRGGYFIERVRRELEERIGSHIYTAGLRIYTTLDRVAQQAAEEELLQQLRVIEGGQYGRFRHPRFAEAEGIAEETGETPYLQGAAIVLDAATGEVRALVGGRDWGDSKFDRATQALRQPGSAFKPFVYLAALERFRSPIHQVEDTPLRLTLTGGRVWEPRNYGDSYDGIITLRDALARSKNTATVRLAQDVGLGAALRSARDLGITSELPDFPATALGAADVRPIEMVAAFAAFTNGGHRVEPHFIRRVEDRNGRLLWTAAPRSQKVLNEATAFVLTSMLRDVVDRGTATAVRAVGFGGPAAGKTGTTNRNTDVWFVGYTPELVAGVWMGFDRPTTIVPGASGGTLAAPVWGRIMRRIYQNRPMPGAWQPPSGVVTAEVERGTGAVVGPDCPAQGPTYTEYFVSAPPYGLCPRDVYPYYAAEFDWGDEEWDYRTGPDTLAERGIIWPELEEMREERAREGAPVDGEPADTLDEPREERPVEPEPPDDGQRYDTIAPPPIREQDLPGEPARPGQRR